MASGINYLTIRRSDYLEDYLRVAPLSLSLIRAIECEMLCCLKFERPVLDLGCGDGLFIKTLFNDPVDCGVDISQREIKLAKKRGQYLRLEVAGASSMPFPDNQFKTVFSNCVVEHLGDLNDCFRETCRVLAPGGRFYCTTHSDRYDEYFLYSTLLKKSGLEGASRRYSNFWRKLWSHYNCLSAEEWESRLKEAGFSEVRVIPYFNRRAVYIFDLFLPLAAASYITRKLLGRWKIFPRILTLKPAYWLLKRFSIGAKEGDWCYLLEAVK